MANKMQRFTIFFITVSALHVSGGFSAHHQELKNCTHSIGYMPSLRAATASVGELELHFQLNHSPDPVCTVGAKKPPETCRALTIIKNIVKRRILLVILKRIH